MSERLRKQLMESTPEWFPAQQDPRIGAPRVPIFQTFESRNACSLAGVHSPNYAGIHGTARDGAFSICLSGGYKDDKDDGETLIYTGTGGQENSFSSGGGEQVDDQTFAHPDNAALLKSAETKRPIRVIRGFNSESLFAPPTGYRYDGLYTVEKAYLSKGVSGYAVCTYELRRVPGQPPIPKRSI